MTELPSSTEVRDKRLTKEILDNISLDLEGIGWMKSKANHINTRWFNFKYSDKLEKEFLEFIIPKIDESYSKLKKEFDSMLKNENKKFLDERIKKEKKKREAIKFKRIKKMLGHLDKK